MSRVLLIFEDYTELTTVESNLKKVGFDVMGMSNEFSLGQHILSFNPDIVVVNGNSSRVNSISTSKRLKDSHRWNGKVLLIFQPQSRPSPEELQAMRMDFALEYPIAFTQLLTAMAQLLGTSSANLLERWKKVKTTSDEEQTGDITVASDSVNQEDAIFVTGGMEDNLAEEISNLERREIEKDLGGKNWNRELEDFDARKEKKKYPIKQMAKDTGFDPKKSLGKKEAKRRLKKLREDWSTDDLENQDKLRRQFTQALFKKSR